MSFITKRERVFNEYDLFDLPARNEGKLKAYASCTDARAWSHFCSDKSEHLVEIIKRNNDTCRPKYVPTEAIVNTLMVGKNAEIARLKQKIEEFEQMLAAYDELELTCDQKCEIAKAHAAIKAANKELDDLCLDLDLSGFTEGIDSEAFETGKSRGDEPSRYKDEETPRSKGDETSYFLSQWTFEGEPPQNDTKSNQVGLSCPCDASTSVVDPRIDEMQDTIITKDAKLNAMQNTIAVMENDVCEPYCIYAHIYTALEKIFGILCQNEKYKLYLDLMTSGKDTRCIDIKGKILYKLKVLEKFSLALIAPCSQDIDTPPPQDCSCYRAEFITRVETTYALTSAELEQPCRDNKRAQLVADIMENEEMKEILSKENTNPKHNLEIDESDTYNIDSENLKRLKNLQESYDDLMTCYEALKHEKDCLLIRCRKYEELEKEFESVRGQLREYNALWNEKEHYRKRSADLDALKKQYLVLSDETSSLEIQINAEHEINKVKTKNVQELTRENLLLEEKLNAAYVLFEKEKNALQCKLKESECKTMRQDQQIRSLSIEVDKLLEQDHAQGRYEETNAASLAVIEEMNCLKEQINNLKDVICENDREKQELQKTFNEQIEDIKSKYNCLHKYANDLEDENQSVMKTNNVLTQKIEKQTVTLNQLIDNKSLEEKYLIEYVDKLNEENNNLCKKIDSLQETCESVKALDDEKAQAIKHLQIACQESQELLEKVNSYNNSKNTQYNLSNSSKTQIEDYEKQNSLLIRTPEHNTGSEMELSNRYSNDSMIIHQIQKLRELNQYAATNINMLQDQKNEYKVSLELEKKESKILQDKLENFENLSCQLLKLKDSHESLTEENNKLKLELDIKKLELDDAIVSINLKKKESEEVVNKLHESLNLRDQELTRELVEKKKDFLKISRRLDEVEHELIVANSDNEKLLKENNILQSKLDSKMEENKNLQRKINKKQDLNQILIEKNSTLVAFKEESNDLRQRLKYYEALQTEYNKLQRDHDQVRKKNNELEKELDRQVNDTRRIKRENQELSTHSLSLLSHSETLEKALIDARKEHIEKSSVPENYYVDIVKDIEALKHDKFLQNRKIRDLQDKLDESETVIAKHVEQIMARDDTIAIMENHINKLEDEVQNLHRNLAEVIHTREQITDHSVQQIQESLKLMEAHHSKATHNMKMELEKIQSINTMLEENISNTKMKNEECIREKHKYMSQIMHLQTEKEIIVTDIKQLEINSVGDSALSPERCDAKDILDSLDRIRRFLNARSSKSTSLEQTLLSVQNSYQLVQTKADEAKKIVEKEKLKILNEKAIEDKINMERQLIDLRGQLEQEVIRNQSIIKDSQAEILNQKLIIDKLNKSRSKLEENIKDLQNLFVNSSQKTTVLENELKAMTLKNTELVKTVEKTNKAYEENHKEVELLNRKLVELKKEPKQLTDVQTSTVKTSRNMESQTENYSQNFDSDLGKKKRNDLQDNNNINSGQVTKATHNKQYEYIPNNKMNEVQVLTAAVDPSFNYVRSCYLNYKFNQLSPGRLEQYSISCFESVSHGELTLENNFTNNPETQNMNVIDIYNKQSMHTNSSKIVDHDDTEIEIIENLENNQSPAKSSAFTEFGLTNESFATESNLNNEYKDRNLFESTSEVSTDKDLFLIYRDSDINQDKSYEKKGPWNANGNSEIIVEAVTVHVNKQRLESNKRHNARNNEKHQVDNDSFGNIDYDEDDSVKQKLEISIPRVEVDTPFLIASDTEQMSRHSDTIATCAIPKEYPPSAERNVKTSSITSIKDGHYVDSVIAAKSEKSRNIRKIKRSTDTSKVINNKLTNPNPLSQGNSNKKGSDNNLYRVGADVLLLNTNISDRAELFVSNSPRKQKPKYSGNNTGYVYHNKNNNNTAKAMRKVRSDELFDSTKQSEINDSIPSIQNELKNLSTDFKNGSSGSYSNSREKDYPKSYIDSSVMVKLDIEEYENKIQQLTNTLDNVERDYKNKIDAIKIQYDYNIKNILNEHNQGVESMQGLHEETLQDIKKIHENEVENLRSMSIEAMRIADKLEKENRTLKNKIYDCSPFCLEEEPIKLCTPELNLRKTSRLDSKLLSKTHVEAFDVKPKSKAHGPCTCSLDVNVSDTIRNIFDQVDVEQRKIAEYTYMKHIANKMLNGNVEILDPQELSFLHLKVCRIWKTKINKEETLQKRIDSLEAELMNKQKHTQHNIEELDRQVAEERRRLQVVREAVCRNNPTPSHCPVATGYVPPVPPPTAEKDLGGCSCKRPSLDMGERRSAGHLAPVPGGLRSKRTRNESNRAVLAKLDAEERREKKLYPDEQPTRLRKSHDRDRQTMRKK